MEKTKDYQIDVHVRVKSNDPDVNTDETVYTVSCGSLSIAINANPDKAADAFEKFLRSVS